MPRVLKTVSGMLSASQYLTVNTVPNQSAKNALQEWCADKKRRLPPPVYKTVAEKGPEHKRIFERSCSIGERTYAIGVGKNQKLADADAAEKTLKILMAENEKKRLSVPDESAVERLMEYVRSARLSGASFYDLGEAEGSTPERPSFRVACKIGEINAEGVGVSKKNARCDSAAKMLSLLKKQSAPKQKNGLKRKNIPAKSVLAKTVKNKT